MCVTFRKFDMGGRHSRVGFSLVQGLAGESNDFFQIGYDDEALGKQFEARSVEASPESSEEINFPGVDLLVNMLLDPKVYTTEETAELVWERVLAPLFCGREGQLSESRVIIDSLLKFLRERINPFIEKELAVRGEMKIKEDGHRSEVARCLARAGEPNPDVLNIGKLIVNMGTEAEAAETVESMNLFVKKMPIVDTEHTFTRLTNKMKGLMSKEASPELISACFKLGIFAGDIECMLLAMMSLAYRMSKGEKKVSCYNWQGYKSLFQTFRLNNAVWLPEQSTLVRWVPLSKYQIPSILNLAYCSACDGSRYYVIGHGSSVLTVELAKGWADEARYRENGIPLSDDEKMEVGMGVSNGHALIVTKSQFKIFRIPTFARVADQEIRCSGKGKSKARPCLPMTSDSRYIYCLNKMKILIFSISDDGVLCHERTVKLTSDNKLPPKFPDLVPTGRHLCYCNGVVFSILVPSYENANHFAVYFVRNFSVINGSHIGDDEIRLRWVISSICCDPINRTVWALSPGADDKMNLIQLPCNSSVPMWMGGYEMTSVYELDCSKLFQVKTHEQALQAICGFLMYYMAHFFGSSIQFLGKSLSYDLPTVKFFGSCTPSVINTAMRTFQFFLPLYQRTTSQEHKRFYGDILALCLSIVDFNLANFCSRLSTEPNGQSTVIELTDTKGITSFFSKILSDGTLSFLHRMVSFIVINSFSVLYENPSDLTSKLFLQVHKSASFDLLLYLTNALSRNPKFAVAVNAQDCRELFSPMLAHLASLELAPGLHELEFISCFLRNLMLELGQVYSVFDLQGELGQRGKYVSDVFVAFSNIISEQFSMWFVNPNGWEKQRAKFKVSNHPFLKVFCKWVMLLEPITKSSRASKEATAFLQPIYVAISSAIAKVTDPIFNEQKDITQLGKMFLEVFSLYSEFVGSLLDGGVEMKIAADYEWLIRATVESQIQPKDVASLVTEIKSQKTLKGGHLLRRGFSFNIIDKTSPETSALEMFVRRVASEQATDDVSALMAFLYKKAANPLNRKLKPEDIRLERLLLAALMKQLGFTSELLDITKKLAVGENVTVISHFAKQTMQVIYQIRRRLMESKQMTAQLQATSQNNMVPVQPVSLEQQYDKYVDEVFKKAVFLLHIQPCLRFGSPEVDKSFPEMLKRLQHFLASPATVDSYFESLRLADRARQQVSLGMALISDMLKRAECHTREILVNRLAHSSAVRNLFSSTSPSGSLFDQIKIFVREIQSHVRDFDGVTLNTLIVLILNLTKSLKNVDTNLMLSEIVRVAQSILDKGSLPAGKMSMTLNVVMAAVLAVVQEKRLAGQELLKQLQTLVFPDDKVTTENMPLIRLCMKIGMDVHMTEEICISLVDSTFGEVHDVLSILEDLLPHSKSKILIFSRLLSSIAMCVAGIQPLIDGHVPFSQRIRTGDVVTVPLGLFAKCTELIQFCRKILIGSGDATNDLKQIICYVLRRFVRHNACPQNPELRVVDNRKVLYAVFALLSNVIDAVQKQSIIKNVANNIMYYIENIDSSAHMYTLWQLPLNADSRPVKLAFSEQLVPVCTLPFSTTSFQEIELLLPYFERLFAEEEDDMSPILEFLVMASFKEYATDQAFRNSLTKIVKRIPISSIVYNDSHESFLRVLHASLLTGSQGIQDNNNFELAFYGFSPAPLESQFQISNTLLRATAGTVVFLSSFLPEHGVSVLKVDAKCKDFDIGLYSPDIAENGAEQALVSVRKGVVIGGDGVSAKIEGCRQFFVNYDPIFGGTIFMGKSNRTDLKVFPNRTRVCFVVVIHRAGDVEYSLVTERNQNVLPLAGSTVMIRRNEKIKNKNDLLKVLRSKPSLHVQSDGQLDFRSFRPRDPDCHCRDIPSPGAATDEVLVTYPENLVASLPPILDSRGMEKFSRMMPCFGDCALDERQAQLVSVPDSSLYVVGEKNSVVRYHTRETLMAYTVDPLSGKVSLARTQMVSIPCLPPFTPTNYTNLPTHFLRYFARGYNKLMRVEMNNHLLLMFLADHSVPVEQTMSMFCLDMRAMIEHMLRMLLYVEKIQHDNIYSNTCPVNFDVDGMDRQVSVPSYLHVYKDALMRIMEHFEANDTSLIALDCWFDILKKQFDDPFAHSCHPENADVLMKTMDMIQSPFIYRRSDVNQWLVMRVTPTRSTKSYFRVNGDSVNDHIVAVAGNQLTFEFPQQREITFAAIPIKRLNASTLVGTFYELILSFKYFVLQLKTKNVEVQAKYRRDLYSFVFNSLTARSPFFVQFAKDVFLFLGKNIPVQSSDISGKYIQNLNLLATFNRGISVIDEFLQDQQILYDEKVLLPFKSFFREFLSEDDKREVAALPEIEWGIPSCPWPSTLKKEDPKLDIVVTNIRRVLLPRQDIVGMPIQLFVWAWTKLVMMAPPFTSKTSLRTLTITFTFYRPRQCVLFVAGSERVKFTVNDVVYESGHPFPVTETVSLTLKEGGQQWNELVWAVIATPDNTASVSEVLHDNIDRFTSDMKAFLVMFDSGTDQDILSTSISLIRSKANLETNDLLKCPQTFLSRATSSLPLHMVALRGYFLLILNWLVLNGVLSASDNANSALVPFFAPAVRLARFRTEIISRSHEDRSLYLTINRQTAEEVRDGLNKTFSNTLIAQLASRYKSERPNKFRSCLPEPWHVDFTGERGIDAGGLARELVTEAAIDLCTPNCGLVIPVPNARNEVGDLREMVIPYPNSDQKNVRDQYRFAGVLIGMAIRTGLVQDFTFPPLVWDYLVTGEVKIERIFEIDENYRLLIQSLQEAQRSDIDDATFISRFNLTMVVLDSRGIECPLSQRGRLEMVTLSRCGEYIARANEYRCNELKGWLEEMRRGFWENLDFEEPGLIDWRSLEYAACGEDTITAEQLKAVTISNLEPARLQMFWRVVENLTADERTALLKFATGRRRLPPFFDEHSVFLKIDSDSSTDALPKASTCFHTLHLPTYTEYSKAYQLIRAAIRFSNTYELG